MWDFRRRQSKVHELVEDMSAAQKQKWIKIISNGRQLVDTEENLRIKYELERLFGQGGEEKYHSCLQKIQDDIDESNLELTTMAKHAKSNCDVSNWMEMTKNIHLDEKPVTQMSNDNPYFDKSNDNSDKISVYDDF